MAAKSSKGLKICITKGTATGNALTATAISSAKPAVVTVAATAGMAEGDMVFVGSVGYSEIANRVFTVSNISGTDFELVGSDTSSSTGSLSSTPTITHFAAADIECLCLSSLSISSDTPGTVDVGTYCDPTASLPSAATSAGTLDFSGYVDITDTDYKELLLAAEDNKIRYMRITLPNNGAIVFPVTFSSITWDLPLDGAVGYSGSAVLGSKPRHLF